MATCDVRLSVPVDGQRLNSVRYAATRLSAIPATTTYRHRARRTSTGVLIYWTVTGAPDTTGAQSGYAGDVSDVVILEVSIR